MNKSNERSEYVGAIVGVFLVSIIALEIFTLAGMQKLGIFIAIGLGAMGVIMVTLERRRILKEGNRKKRK